jgi:hypothetical protein
VCLVPSSNLSPAEGGSLTVEMSVGRTRPTLHDPHLCHVGDWNALRYA